MAACNSRSVLAKQKSLWDTIIGHPYSAKGKRGQGSFLAKIT